ncbi:MAG TPA: co-chaperone GroES family protein [Candidatus Angelobacter sp.]|nr:co-chaperone GroES family protein [Candidatus Angelobacter sp.]
MRQSRLLGYVENPVQFFEREKRRVLDQVGDLYDIRVPLNRILVAIWTTKEERRTEGGLIIHTSDKSKDENKWQGVSGLVLKMGPAAYAENDAITFCENDKCQVGDWVLFRKGEGFRVEVWQQECVMLESERAIKAILDRPDAVF